MNKILRYSLLAVLAIVGMGNANAQEVTIDFSGTTDNWGIGTTKIVEEKEFVYGGCAIKLKGTEGNGYRWYDTGNIILGKNGATLTLPAFSFDVERIDVVGTSSASANVLQNIYVGETAVSTQTKGAQGTNLYEIASANQAAGNIYVLKVESNHNTQITKILIWKKGTSSDPTVKTVTNIADLTALGAGADAIFAPTDAKVTYVNGKNVYVRDNTGGMCFYNQSAMSEATNKWQLGGKITGKVSIYNGLTQFTISDASAMTHTDGTAYEPVSISSADAASHIADLVKLTDEITVYVDGTKYYTSSEKTLQIYDNFKLNYTLSADDKITGLTGVIIPYNKQIEIAPTVSPTITDINTINADTNANAPAYNLAGQKIADGFKGLVIKNGKKYMMK